MTTTEKNELQRDIESITLRLHNAGMFAQAQQATAIRNAVAWCIDEEESRTDPSPEASLNEFKLTDGRRRGIKG